MKYFFIAVAFILSVYLGHRVVASMSPDMAQKSGLDQSRKQAEEDEVISP